MELSPSTPRCTANLKRHLIQKINPRLLLEQFLRPGLSALRHAHSLPLHIAQRCICLPTDLWFHSSQIPRSPSSSDASYKYLERALVFSDSFFLWGKHMRHIPSYHTCSHSDCSPLLTNDTIVPTNCSWPGLEAACLALQPVISRR